MSEDVKQLALEADAALVRLLAQIRTRVWPEELRIISAAIQVVREYE